MNKKIKKVGIIGATFTTNNRGVSALLDGAIQCVMNCYSEVEIKIIDYGIDQYENYKYDRVNQKISRINLRFSKRIYLKNNIAVLIVIAIFTKIIPFRKLRKMILQSNMTIKEISQCNLIVSIAGGDSFSDIYGVGRFFYVSLPKILALLLSLDLVLLPQTIGPFKKVVSRNIAKYILGKSAFVYTRDLEGLKYISDILSVKEKPKFKFCYDLGFLVPPSKPKSFDSSFFKKKSNARDIIVGLNISGLLFMGGYNKKNMFKLKFCYSEFIYELIEFLLEKKRCKIVLIPHVFGNGICTESDSSINTKICNDLKIKYSEILTSINQNYDQREIKYIIGKCDFFIGSRMHACIAALSQEIPAVSIAYSKKFFGVYNSLGVESLVADPRNLRKNEVMSIVEYGLENLQMYNEKLKKIMPEVKERIINILRQI